MSDNALIIERRGPIVMATINRPQSMNALNSEVRSLLTDFWLQVRDDDSIRVAIITGAGDRAFSAGRDLKETAQAYREGRSTTAAENTGRLGYPSDLVIGKPVIAAIKGYCLAAGFKVAMGCDIRIAAETAVFGNPQVRVGRGTEMPVRLIKAGIPLGAVMDLTLTGDFINAQQALMWGLVSRIVPTADLTNTAWAMAETISKNSPMVAGGIINGVTRGIPELPMQQALKEWNEIPNLFGATADARIGAQAFADGRDPVYG